MSNYRVWDFRDTSRDRYRRHLARSWEGKFNARSWEGKFNARFRNGTDNARSRDEGDIAKSRDGTDTYSSSSSSLDLGRERIQQYLGLKGIQLGMEGI